MSKKNRFYLGLVVILGAFVLTHELSKISWQSMKTEFSQLNWGWLLVAALCMLFYWGMEARVIQVLSKKENKDLSFAHVYRIPLIEHLFNSITPFSTGGQPAQLVALSQAGVDPGVSGSICLMKFVIYQVLIVVNFIGCVIFGFKIIETQLHTLSLFVILGFLIHVIVVVVLLMLMYWYPMTNKIVHFCLKFVKKFTTEERGLKIEQSILQKMENFYEESKYIRSQKKLVLRVCVLTFLQLAFYYVVPYFILLSLGIQNVSLFHVVIMHAFIILIISLFPVPGGAGGAEYTFTLLFGTFVLVKAKLVFAIILWRIITLYMGIVLGLITLVFRPKSLRKKSIEN